MSKMSKRIETQTKNKQKKEAFLPHKRCFPCLDHTSEKQ